MSQAKLETVTLNTLANAARAANKAVDAYRMGSHRLLKVIDVRVTTPAVARTQRYSARLAKAMQDSGSRAQGLAAQGVDRLSDGADTVIQAGSTRAAAGVKRVARLAFQVQNPVLSKGLDTAARLSLPAAQATLAITERVAAAADKLPAVVAGGAVKAGRKTKAAKATETTKAAKATKAAPAVRTQKAAVTAKPAKAPVRRAAAKPVAPTFEQAVAKAGQRVQRSTQRAADAAASAGKAVRARAVKAAQPVQAAAKPAVRRSREAVKAVKAAAKPVVEAVASVAAVADQA